VQDISYNPEMPMFRALVEAIALSTTSFFDYNPSDEEIRGTYIKAHRLKDTDMPTSFKDMTEMQKQRMNEQKMKLIKIEKDKYFIKRNVEGDASETGLVKFVMPILMKKYGGQFDDGLDGIRKFYPIIKL